MKQQKNSTARHAASRAATSSGSVSSMTTSPLMARRLERKPEYRHLTSSSSSPPGKQAARPSTAAARFKGVAGERGEAHGQKTSPRQKAGRPATARNRRIDQWRAVVGLALALRWRRRLVYSCRAAAEDGADAQLAPATCAARSWPQSPMTVAIDATPLARRQLAAFRRRHSVLASADAEFLVAGPSSPRIARVGHGGRLGRPASLTRIRRESR